MLRLERCNRVEEGAFCYEMTVTAKDANGRAEEWCCEIGDHNLYAFSAQECRKTSGGEARCEMLYDCKESHYEEEITLGGIVIPGSKLNLPRCENHK